MANLARFGYALFDQRIASITNVCFDTCLLTLVLERSDRDDYRASCAHEDEQGMSWSAYSTILDLMIRHVF